MVNLVLLLDGVVDHIGLVFLSIPLSILTHQPIQLILASVKDKHAVVLVLS